MASRHSFGGAPIPKDGGRAARSPRPFGSLRVLMGRFASRRVASSALTAFGLAASLLLPACPRDRGTGEGREDERLVVGRLSTELHAFDRAGEPLELSASLDAIAREALGGSKQIRLTETEERPDRGARLRVRAMVAPDGASGELHAIVSARLDRTGSIPLTSDLDAVRPAHPDGGQLAPEVYAEHLTKAVRDTLAGLEEQVRVLRGGNESLVEALGSADPSVRVAAVRELGERRAAAAIAPLCRLLESEPGPVGEAAVGALAAIGQAQATPCLIRWAGTDERRVLLVIEPLASLGDEEARAFLEMLASGHDSPGIRRVAEHAVGRLPATPAAPAGKGRDPSSDRPRPAIEVPPPRPSQGQ